MTGIDQKSIYGALRQVIGDGDDFVVLHSALYAFRVQGAALKWPLLGALRQLTREGHTLALPCFSFDFCRGKDFHHLRSPSQSGQLGDWFRELMEVRRSPHPIYSFAVAGPRAVEILDCKNSTTFGSDSPFGLFEREDARLVMFGCPWSACTQFHFYEEAAAVPYRYYKTFASRADFGDGPREATTKMFVRDLDVGAENDFVAAVSQLRWDDAIAAVEWQNGVIEAASSKQLGRTCRDQLTADPFVFVKRRGQIQHALASKAKLAARPPLRVAVLGAANLAFLRTAIAEQLGAVITDQRVEVYAPPFGQSQKEIFEEHSPLHDFQPQFIFCVDRLEDIRRVDTLDGAAADDDQALESHVAAIEACAERFQAKIIVNRFANLQPSTAPATNDMESKGPAADISEANSRLEEALGRLASCHSFDLAQAAQRFAQGEAHDSRLWHIGRFPFSQGFTQDLARRYAGLVLAATGRSLRLLVVDLDDTLWGGVLGEDGIEGLQLGGDYPGNAYAAFQRTLKQLSERGVALAIASKNDETEARQAMARLPGMVLREDDFAAFRINWRDKAENLQEIAQELGLGLEHIGFVDDNPAERARMRQTLPEVKVVELGLDPARYSEDLLRSPYLDCLELTEEDRSRAKRYAARRRVRQEEKRFTRVEDFYAYLQPKLHVEPLTPVNGARAEQLAMKTNQFNTTLLRYSRSELERRAKDGDGVYLLGLEDRFTERENIGLLVVDWGRGRSGAANIDLLLLSCRVLGRGVESAALSWIADTARRRGMTELRGEIVEGPRNEPVRDLYAGHGFRRAGDQGSWRLDLSASSLSLPNWIQLSTTVKEPAHAA